MCIDFIIYALILAGILLLECFHIFVEANKYIKILALAKWYVIIIYFLIYGILIFSTILLNFKFSRLLGELAIIFIYYLDKISLAFLRKLPIINSVVANSYKPKYLSKKHKFSDVGVFRSIYNIIRFAIMCWVNSIFVTSAVLYILKSLYEYVKIFNLAKYINLSNNIIIITLLLILLLISPIVNKFYLISTKSFFQGFDKKWNFYKGSIIHFYGVMGIIYTASFLIGSEEYAKALSVSLDQLKGEEEIKYLKLKKFFELYAFIILYIDLIVSNYQIDKLYFEKINPILKEFNHKSL